MDTIWDRKSEVIDRCGGDEKNRMTTQNRQKSNAKKNKNKNKKTAQNERMSYLYYNCSNAIV